MRKYKIYDPRNEKVFVAVILALLLAFLIWYHVGKNRSPEVLLFQLPLFVILFLIQPKDVRLHDDDTLEYRQYIKNKWQKPISVQQITSYQQDAKNKNKLTIVYYREQLRGSWTICLSEKDVDDLVSELVRRNPAIIKQ